MEPDRQEELTVVRIAEVEMMQQLVRQGPPRFVQHFHVRGMERRVHGHEDLAEREPDHRLAPTAGRRHIHRGQLNYQLMRTGVHEHRRAGQRFGTGTGAGAAAEQHYEEEKGPHAGGSGVKRGTTYRLSWFCATGRRLLSERRIRVVVQRDSGGGRWRRRREWAEDPNPVSVPHN